MEWRQAESVAEALAEQGFKVTIDMEGGPPSYNPTVTVSATELTVEKLENLLPHLKDGIEADFMNGKLQVKLT